MMQRGHSFENVLSATGFVSEADAEVEMRSCEKSMKIGYWV